MIPSCIGVIARRGVSGDMTALFAIMCRCESCEKPVRDARSIKIGELEMKGECRRRAR